MNILKGITLLKSALDPPVHVVDIDRFPCNLKRIFNEVSVGDSLLL